METQNITLSLSKDLLVRVKLIAVKRGTSVSRLLTSLLEELARQEDPYERARRRHLAWLRHGADLGTRGQLATTRDEVHERR